MKTYSEFVAENKDRFFWSSDAGIIEGRRCLYVTVEYFEGNTNKLCAIRDTVIDDRI